MSNIINRDTVIFDFDGTIADTLQEVRLVVNRLAEEHDFKSVSAEELHEMRKLTLTETMKELGISKLLLPILLAKGTEVKTKANVVGVLTSNSTENVELFLERNGMSGYFDFIKSSTLLSGKSKSLKQIFKKINRNASEAIYVGDEVRDIEACQKVGLPIASVTWGFNACEVLEKHRPDYLIDTTEDLKSCLDTVLETPQETTVINTAAPATAQSNANLLLILILFVILLIGVALAFTLKGNADDEAAKKRDLRDKIAALRGGDDNLIANGASLEARISSIVDNANKIRTDHDVMRAGYTSAKQQLKSLKAEQDGNLNTITRLSNINANGGHTKEWTNCRER